MSANFHEEVVGKLMLPAEPGELTDDLKSHLWTLLDQVGIKWEFTRPSSGTRSSWHEFVTLRCEVRPSYLEEYRNALHVIDSLASVPGETDPVGVLFNHQVPAKLGDGSTRLDHAKRFVVEEFIMIRIVAGGFREFGGKKRPYNYNGFVRGTRYNRVMRVRAYQPEKFQPTRCARSWKSRDEA